MNPRHTPVLRWTGIALVAAVLAFGPLLQGLFYWTQLLFAQAVVALGFILWATARVREGKPLGIPGGFVGKALPVLGLCYLVLLPVARYPRGDLDWVMRVFTAWLVFVMLRQESSPTTRRAFGWIVVAGMTAVAVIGLLQYTGSFARDQEMVKSLALVNLGGRLSSTMQYPNTEAIMFLMAMVLAIGLAAERPKAVTFIPAALAANLLFIAFFFALSRGAVLVFPIVMLMLFVGLPKGMRWPTLMALSVALLPAIVALRGIAANSAIQNYVSAWRWIAASGVAAVAGGAVAAWVLAWPRRRQYAVVGVLAVLACLVVAVRVAPAMGNGETGIAGLLPKQAARLLDMNLKTINVQLRLNASSDALKIFASRPWGSGGWGWERSYRQVQQFNYVMRETHNHYAQTAAEAGIVGVVALITALLGTVWVGWRSRKVPHVWYTTVALAAVTAHSLVDFNLSFGAVWLILWAACGMVAGAKGGEQTVETVSGSAVSRLRGMMRVGGNPRVVLAAAGLLLVGSLALGTASQLAGRATALLESGEPKRALPLMAVARVLDPLNSDIARSLGEARQQSGDFTGGISVYRAATRLDRFYPLNWAALGSALVASDQSEEALVAERRTLALQPMLGNNYSRLAQTLSAQLIQHLVAGDREQAMAKAEELVSLGEKLEAAIGEATQHKSQWAPPEWTPVLHYAYGQGLYLAGDLKAAEENLRLAAEEPVMATQAEVWLYALFERTGQSQAAQVLASRPWIRFRGMNAVYGAIAGWK